jgi:DTW domain-containing protein YfiP
VLLGTAPLLRAGLTRAELRCGLSWPSLTAALGAEAVPARWAVLYPSSLPRPLDEAERAAPFVLMAGRGGSARADHIDGLVVLDGTWSQAKSLWWRNGWLTKLARAVVHPLQPSIYGRLRKEPQRHCVSTLEAALAALAGLGEPPQVQEGLLRAFRTLVQRVRDAR